MGRSVEAPGDALIYSTFVLVDKGGWIRRGSKRGLRKKRQAKRGHAETREKEGENDGKGRGFRETREKKEGKKERSALALAKCL